jgi:ATP-dependent HslUV protease ATP-binding subunit HslU
MVRDLLDLAINMVRTEQTEVVRQEAERRTVERILDALVPPAAGSPGPADEASDRRHRNREKFRVQFEEGQLDDREIDIEVEEKLRTGPLVTAVGLDQMDVSLQDVFEQLVPGRRRERRLPIREARRVLFQQECDKLIDREKVTAMAVQRTESSGIIFLDEIDKICQTETRHGADVSRQGVQRDLLPIVEGTVVQSRHGPVKTDHILFIAAGAFHSSKPSDLMPELQGRFPIRVELNDLDRDDFVRILTEPKNALTKQHIALLATEGVTLKFDGSAIAAMADISTAVNRSTQNTGARRLYTIMEKVLETISFEAPERTGQTLVIDEATVRRTLESIVKDEDLSRFIL